MSLKQKIITFFTFLIALNVCLLSWYTFRSTNSIIEGSEENLTVILTNSISNEVKDALDLTEVNVRSIVENQKVQELFAARDREGLIEYLMPMYEGLKNTFSQAHFHLPDSVSFLRLHKVEKYGDSLKDFRFTVNVANEEKKMVKGIEGGVSGLGFRVVMPVSYQGTHIGSFELGRKFDQEFLQSLQEAYGGEFYLYTFDEQGRAVYIDSAAGEEKIYEGDTASLEMLKAGSPVHTMTEDKKYNHYMIPFYSFDGQAIGFMQAIMDRSEILAKNAAIMRNMVIFIVVILLMIVALAYFYLTRSFRPLHLLMEKSKVIAGGDFTDKVEIRHNDEIGLLSGSLNNISDNLKKMLSAIAAMAYDVANTSEILSASSEEITASGENINRNMNEVSDLAEKQLEVIESSKTDVHDMAQGISELNGSVKRINESMNSVIQSTKEGMSASKMIEDRILNLKQTSGKTTENIDKLNKSSREIEDILTTIQGIADETNLLALNASIEAARAGEAGRGFAVVAGEVGKLAEQSRNSTGRIDALIKEIQSDITLVVASMDESNREVEEGVTVVQNSNGKFKEIEREVMKTVDQILEITESVENIYGRIDRVLSSFEGIVEKSNDTTEYVNAVKNTMEDQTAAMLEVTHSTINLAELAMELKKAVSQFKYE